MHGDSRVLVVEDDPDVGEMMRLTLETSGYDVELVTNGADALAAVKRRRPGLMILDLVMPVMNGWEVIRQLTARGLEALPVCVVSAVGENVPTVAVATLRKPFEVDALRAIVDRYCTRRTPPVTSG